MRIQPAAHISRISGKQDDVVFIHTKSGTFARSAGRRCRYASAQQLLVRRFVGEAARLWKSLDSNRRYSWSLYARAIFIQATLGEA